MKPISNLLAGVAILALLSFDTYAGPKDLAEQKPAALSFIENKGQVTDQFEKQRKDIDFKVSAGGMNIFVGDGQIHYQWMKDLRPAPPSEMPEKLDPREGREAFMKYMEAGVPMETYRLDVVLLGANKNAELITEEQQSYQEHYYLPQYSGTVSSYHKITYKNIYPNIDWVLYTSNNQLKYDFVVHPGGNPNDIKLQYKGATALKLRDGALTATTPFGSITEQKPYSYDAITKQEIESSFVLSEDVLSFKMAGTNINGLVIDPYLEWATYYGGSSNDWGLDVASDDLGDVYMTGGTTSGNNISTVGAHKTTNNFITDAFLVKFNSAGIRQWGTYLGGEFADLLTNIAFDTAGNVYVSGSTGSYFDITTVGAYSSTLRGSYDAVLAKFTTGGVLIWSTYFGGSGVEYGKVVCDLAGNIYLVGGTTSSNGIATPGAYQTSNAGSFDSFISCWTSNGGLLWATYFGTSEKDWATGASCDGEGNIYVGGGTWSDTGMATNGAHQQSGNYDGFLSKWAPTGGLLWATYYGGSGDEEIRDVACDVVGNVYVVGNTTSSNAIATVGSHQPVHSWPSNDGFIAKFSASGVRQWGTYYGGTFGETMMSLDVGVNNCVYVCGYTSSNSGIATVNGYRTTKAGSVDIFLVELTASGERTWGTYYGGTAADRFSEYGLSGYTSGNGGRGITTSFDGKLYLAGTTESDTGIATPGAHQMTHSNVTILSNQEAFLTSWNLDTLYIRQPFVDSSFCHGQAFTIDYRTSSAFNSGNIFSFQLSDSSGSFASPLTLATKADVDSGSIVLTIPSTLASATGYRIRIVSTSPARISPENARDIRIAPLPIVSASSNSPVCEADSLELGAGSTVAGNIIYDWTGPGGYSTNNNQNPGRSAATKAMAGDYIVTAKLDGCEAVDTTTVVVNTPPVKPTAGSNSPVCVDGALHLHATSSTSGATYTWAGNGFQSTLQNPSILLAHLAHSGKFTVVAHLDSCASLPTEINVEVRQRTTPSVTIKASPGLVVSPAETVLFTADVLHGGTSPKYQWYKNGVILPGAVQATLNLTGLYFYDQISVNIISEDPCADEKNASDTVTIGHPTGIDEKAANNELQLYPNPNKGSFTISGISGREVNIAISNIIGQSVYQTTATNVSGNLQLNTNLSKGVYLIRLSSDEGQAIFKFTITD